MLHVDDRLVKVVDKCYSNLTCFNDAKFSKKASNNMFKNANLKGHSLWFRLMPQFFFSKHALNTFTQLLTDYSTPHCIDGSELTLWPT